MPDVLNEITACFLLQVRKETDQGNVGAARRWVFRNAMQRREHAGNGSETDYRYADFYDRSYPESEHFGSAR